MYNHTFVLQRLNNKPVFVKADIYNTMLNNDGDRWAGLWAEPHWDGHTS